VTVSWFSTSPLAVARRDETVAARCRALVSGLLEQAERSTCAAPDDLARFAGQGALLVLLQPLGVDLSGGSQAAVHSLRVALAMP
jgi:hypothetical protein